MANINDVRRMSDQAQNQIEKLNAARDDGTITAADYDAITDCFNHYAGRDWNTASSQRDRLSQLRLSATRADKSLTAFETIDDVNALFQTHADAGAASANAQRGYAAALRAFYAFLDDHREWSAFPFHDRIKAKTNGDDTTEKLDPSEILDWDDILTLQQHASSPRDSAFIMFLADTGLRVAAACQLRVGDINNIDTDTATFTPNKRASGQKGLNDHEMDEFPIHKSLNYLRTWLNNHHPEAPNPPADAPVFPVRRGYDPDDRANCAAHPRTMQDQIDNAANAAGLDKPHNLHAFRHACVKHLKLNYDYDWTELGNALAWADESVAEMAQRYGKLEGEERLTQLQEKRGIEVAADDDADPVTLTEPCWNCGTTVTAAADYCPQCGSSQGKDARQSTDTADLEARVAELEGMIADMIMADPNNTNLRHGLLNGEPIEFDQSSDES